MIDFEAEGLLDGLEGEARAARLELLERLAGEGVPLEELREAVEGGRLTLLPVERAIAGDGPRHTPREVAELSGVAPRPAAARHRRARHSLPGPRRALADRGRPRRGPADQGLPRRRPAGGGDRPGGADDRHGDGADRRGQPRAGGPHADAAGRHRARPRAALRRRRRAHAAGLRADPLYAFRAHMLEQIRRDVIAAADLASGTPGGMSEVAVCFADLVGFTKLGEQVETEELGADRRPPRRAGDRGGRTAGAAGEADRRRGDARLRRRRGDWSRRRCEWSKRPTPKVRTSRACGPASPRARYTSQAGDYYGRPVNLASRLTGDRQAGQRPPRRSARTRRPARASTYSFAGEKRLKGFDARTRLYRARRPESESRSPGHTALLPVDVASGDLREAG